MENDKPHRVRRSLRAFFWGAIFGAGLICYLSEKQTRHDAKESSPKPAHKKNRAAAHR